MPVGLVPECFECVHMMGVCPDVGWQCAAFREGIPLDILCRQRDHRTAYPGDNGIMFEAVPDGMQWRPGGFDAEEVRSDAQWIIARRTAIGWERVSDIEYPNRAAADRALDVLKGTSTREVKVMRAENLQSRQDEAQVPGETIRAAGVMYVTKDGKVLLCRRSDTGEWAFPGGRIEEGETPEEAAARECEEEVGHRPTDLKPWTRRNYGGVDFTTFIARLEEPFEPTLNDEHTEASWEMLGDYSGASLDHLVSQGRADEFKDGAEKKSDALAGGSATVRRVVEQVVGRRDHQITQVDALTRRIKLDAALAALRRVA